MATRLTPNGSKRYGEISTPDGIASVTCGPNGTTVIIYDEQGREVAVVRLDRQHR
jgi:hypothetical protein